MKNLFKNLMLVAVAAMAFTACQNDNDFAGNAAGEGTTTISVVANLDDTRSAFTGEKGDTGYQSVWNGGEAVKAYVVSDGGYADFYNVAASNESAVEAENGDTEARFNLSFNSSLSNGALYIIAAADASVIGFEGTGYYDGGPKPKITLPTEQTPSDNSVDPKAHILIYENNYFKASQSTDIEATFSHYAAYGKLSLTDFNAEGVTSYVLNINGKMYTINSAKTENVWFACEPATVADMTISVNTTDDTTYTKKIVEGSNKTLAFVKGQVSTFTVNMDGATTGEAVDTFNPTYRLESLSWSGSYFELLTNYVVNDYNTKMYLRLYMHADDRANNNSLKLGNYTCAGGNRVTPSSTGTVNMRYCTDEHGGWPDNATASATLSVSAENGDYVIVATINGQTWGYKGLPEGWPAPVAGGDDNGDEPETPGEGGGDEPVAVLGSESNPYTFATFSSTPLTWTFAEAENGATIVLGLNNSMFETYVGTKPLDSTGGWYTLDHKYTLNGTTYGSGSYGKYSEVTITANGDGSYNFKFRMSVNGGDSIWYVGTGR